MLAKEYRKLRAQMEGLGFVWEVSQSKHIKVHVACPNGKRFCWNISSTPSCNRALKNSLSVLRRELMNAGYPNIRDHLPIASGGISILVHRILDAIESELEWDAV